MVNGRIARTRAFTLVEVLVAMAILSIALLAALRAAGQATNNAEELRARLLATWVAENLLAEQRAQGIWPPTGIARGTVTQAGFTFGWREETSALPNPAFRRMDIFVYAWPGESRVLARLSGTITLPQVTDR